METVWEDGHLVDEQTFADVRARSRATAIAEPARAEA